MVTDQGYPEPKTDTAGTSITVQRDVALPVFDQETYRRDIAESAPVNTSVSQVHAEMDGVIVSRSLCFQRNNFYGEDPYPMLIFL